MAHEDVDRAPVNTTGPPRGAGGQDSINDQPARWISHGRCPHHCGTLGTKGVDVPPAFIYPIPSRTPEPCLLTSAFAEAVASGGNRKGARVAERRRMDALGRLLDDGSGLTEELPRLNDTAPESGAESRRQIVSVRSLPDRLFRGLTRTAAVAVLSVMGLIGLFLLLKSTQAWRRVGLSFLTEQTWFPDVGVFGISAVLLGTVLIALVALVVAVPVAFGAAVFISEYATAGLRRPLISLVDLMAAIPSIVYGLWGLFFLQPRIISLSRWLSVHAGWFPPFKVSGSAASNYTSSTFIAGLVVSLMVIPIVCSLMREVFSQAPVGEREAALALGATRWGMIRTVVIPFGKGGMIGATMLGMGRALGETVGVYLIISPIFTRSTRILESGSNSIAALIANRYQESSSFGIAALMAAGLVLFLMTLIINALASVIVSRSRSGALTEI